jgi:N-formylmaleamate deformylase
VDVFSENPPLTPAIFHNLKEKKMYPNWKQNDLLVKGTKLHYTRTGGGEKPALVLAHGFSDSGLCWLPLARALEQEYDLVLPDARGHGLSARVQPGEEIDAAADLAGLIQSLNLTRPILGGHSMGASVSARTTVRYPNLVRALVLEDPAWFNPPPSRRQPPRKPGQAEKTSHDKYEEWLLTVKDLSLEQVMDKCRQDSPTWAEIELQPWAESKKQFDTNFMVTRSRDQGDWREVAKAIPCPTLLITADPLKGGLITPEIAAEAYSLNSRIQVVRIEGAGHNIRRENFAAYLEAVGGFLGSLNYP